MRVIAGLFRGRLLAAPPGDSTRPITDRVKETLFNILGSRLAAPGSLPEVDVLDMFAGTGGLGIEALSRGARSCVFIERERQALRSLRENLAHCKIGAVCTVLAENAWTTRLPETPNGFGLVFVDPPYQDAADTLRVVDLLGRLAPLVATDGLVVFRHEAQLVFPWDEVHGLRRIDTRRIGRMTLVFFERGAHVGAANWSAEDDRPVSDEGQMGVPAGD